MAKELNEDTGFKVSIKTLIAIGFAMATIISMWFMLQADIQEAKELPIIEIPPPEISRMEFDMKDQNIRLTIQNTADDVAEIKEDIKRLEEKIDKLR
jgi:tRNA threonylcarbamoyladenosine modification (KEOPS) complex  Pcc1 subunit